MRIGTGYDVHRMVPERALILGGVDIPYDLGLLGHSDADVLVHAVMDALIGAAGLGDIGRHFPDTDPRYKDISSIYLLKITGEILQKNGYRPYNIDTVIVAERPKLAAFIPEMRKNIAAALGMEESFVNVKATTTEGLGFAGLGQGIAAYAAVTIDQLA